ncbi:potassium channel family protein [Mycoplasmopsis columbinasalis]|uniref:Potassium uptake protein A n=1 Tax=Mycoplasmopsis columbinasalis TaxID=114880 RepID=A0A449BAW8_9BACT|nr:TrkA family potassium uptake protein [Mycoplasmopsis columbinasalis]VEU78345.1 potassium uptake protein A [Mycoplasmopsis columbinasalis]
MRKLLRKPQDICVIGAGRFGSAVISQLAKSECSLLLIDKSEENLKKFNDITEKIVITDATDIKALKSLKVNEIDTIIVALSDNIEIVATLVELNVKNIIARATSKRHALVLEKIGANIIIEPEFEAGIRTALIATNSNFIKYSKNMQDAGGGFVTAQVVLRNHDFYDQMIKDANFHELKISVVLIKRSTNFILPTGTTELKTDDLLTILGKIEDVTHALEIISNDEN